MAPPKIPPVEQLTLCGEALYGEDWHRQMATELRRYHALSARPTLDYRIIRKWVVADRPVPGWVLGVLPRLLASASVLHPEQAADFEALAARLGYPTLKSIALLQGL
ncbi:hypothetical protein HN018_13010 [Lichenicola cladoniae]|uniref:Uncharacterized protein n=1 Tax=Lichenicola cladoniae TaxID=1484109 RepID=A0A6M8HQV2_9PROT|nr:hypothetical protein [Lichenicola cladoniae]NPD68734.1 hypothetical protein [Acetobacteraceae bacterium]QKE90834.1 hypothetical protein HN018_13010 [Lichenicola cladoniae]